MKAIGYVRVSRVSKRSGDSFLSPELQRQSIERVCQREGLELVDVLEELDKSGGDRAGRCGTRRSRWSNAARPVRWSMEPEPVLAEPPGCARRDRADRGRWSAPAIGGGCHREARAEHPSSRRRGLPGQGARLVPAGGGERDRARHPLRLASADWVHARSEDAETRADRDGPGRCGAIRATSEGVGLDASGVVVHQAGRVHKDERAGGEVDAAQHRVRGWATWSGHVNRNAHPAIVTQLLYDRANAISGRAPKHDGSLSSQLLLRGLVFCVGCGHRMAVSSSAASEGGVRRKVASYRCGNANCPATASIRGIDLDPLVIATLFRMLRLVGPTGFRAAGATAAELARAQDALEEAKYDRRKLVENRDLRRLLTAEEYNASLSASPRPWRRRESPSR